MTLTLTFTFYSTYFSTLSSGMFNSCELKNMRWLKKKGKKVNTPCLCLPDSSIHYLFWDGFGPSSDPGADTVGVILIPSHPISKGWFYSSLAWGRWPVTQPRDKSWLTDGTCLGWVWSGPVIYFWPVRCWGMCACVHVCCLLGGRSLLKK